MREEAQLHIKLDTGQQAALYRGAGLGRRHGCSMLVVSLSLSLPLSLSISVSLTHTHARLGKCLHAPAEV